MKHDIEDSNAFQDSKVDSPASPNDLTYLSGGRLPEERTPKALLRKVDLRLVPIMTACYTLQYIDKGVLNYANIMGLQKDTGLHGDQFSWLVTGFFIAYVVAQIPGIYMLSRMPVNVYLACGTLVCAISIACTAAVNNYPSLIAVRVILAIGEATMSPSLSLVTMKWYTKQEASRRYGYWFTGLGIGQIIGGLISFGFQHVKSGSFGSWRGMFLVLALLNFILAIWTYFFLTDNPSEAKFLTPEEQAYFTARLLQVNKYNVAKRKFNFAHVRATLTTDLSIWIAFLLCISVTIHSGVIVTFSATLISGFGYNAKQSALLNMPGGVCSIIAALASTWFVEYNVPRSVSVLCLVGPTFVGACLLSFAKQKAALLIGTWLINVIGSVVIVDLSWVQANCAGHTKRVVYNAMIMIAFGIGNISGPQTFRAKDAPEYWPARIALLVATGIAGVLTLVLLSLYMWRNRQNQDVNFDQKKQEYDELDERTDFDIPGFRYVY